MKKQIITLMLAAVIGFAVADNDGVKNTTATKNAPVQVAAVSGSVTDFVSGETLAGVEIKLQGTNLKTYSDFDGNFKFSNLKPGRYNIIASFISYKKSLIENFSIDTEKNNLNIKMQGAN